MSIAAEPKVFKRQLLFGAASSPEHAPKSVNAAEPFSSAIADKSVYNAMVGKQQIILATAAEKQDDQRSKLSQLFQQYVQLALSMPS